MPTDFDLTQKVRRSKAILPNVYRCVTQLGQPQLTSIGSIFTFLLGAFAAGFASEAGADQTVYGGYYYIGENYQGSSIERVTVNGSRTTQQAVLALNASATCAVNKEPDGTKVSDWWYVEGDTTVRSWIQTFKNLILKFVN